MPNAVPGTKQQKHEAGMEMFLFRYFFYEEGAAKSLQCFPLQTGTGLRVNFHRISEGRDTPKHAIVRISLPFVLFVSQNCSGFLNAKRKSPMLKTK